MKKVTLIAGLIFIGKIAISQQLGQFSQYLNNQFILNPAAAGEHDYFDVDLNFRQQWVGFEGAPQNYYLSGHTRIGASPSGFANSSLRPSHESDAVTDLSRIGGQERKLSHGVGGVIAADNYGAFKRLNFSAAYALILPIGEQSSLSFGLSAGLANLGFDQNSIALANTTDAVFDQFANGNQRLNLFDLNLGAYYYSDKYFVGYSTNQMMQNKISFGGAAYTGKLNVHHFFSGGYNFDLTDKVILTPSVLVKYMNPAPVSFDVSAKVMYDGKYFGGVSYRHGDAVVAFLGANLNDLVKIGYSYDYTTSEIGTVSNGGHEVMLGIMLKGKQGE